MLKRIVMQLSGQIMALFTQALAFLKELLWNRVSSLLASCTRLFLNVANQLPLFAKTLLSFKVFLANLTTAVQSIKAALKRVVTTSGQNGSQPQTTAPQTRRRASKQPKKDK